MSNGGEVLRRKARRKRQFTMHILHVGADAFAEFRAPEISQRVPVEQGDFLGRHGLLPHESFGFHLQLFNTACAFQRRQLQESMMGAAGSRG